MTSPIIVWFRRDLRVSDNPALHEAVKTGRPVIPLYILETDAARPLGGASLWWLHYSLQSLADDLETIGLTLVLAKGSAEETLTKIIKETKAESVFWNRRYGADAVARDTAMKETLSGKDITVKSYKANLLHEPWEIKNGSGGYYKVFSPFWRAALREPAPERPLPVPDAAAPFEGDITSIPLSALDLLPARPDWGEKMRPFWHPGTHGAKTALTEFLSGPVETYSKDRDRPGVEGTSKLSPHLAFGEISPRQIWHTVMDANVSGDKFLSEIGWREFSYTLLFYNPDLATENFKPAFDAFEWTQEDERLERWQMGLTGYPFVDAGMRQLWATGWQHNRVRMVTASFLIKHLMLDWRHGERWFWDTLVDADPASNAASWQWVAGSGADAAPYFRIFNPFGQGEKFDADGDYVRRWVPELARLPNKFIHAPWEAPKLVLLEAGVTLGKTYPAPIVDHKFARERALQAYKATRS